MRRIIAILNARAGTLLDNRIIDPARALADAFGRRGDAIEVILTRPREMDRELHRAALSRHDTVIVGGGDGTVNHALNILRPSGKTVGVLPLGTVNILARDLNMPPVFAAAVEALAEAQAVEVDLGLLNGRAFHSMLGLGYFAHVAHNRERLRDISLPLIGRHLAWMLSHWRAMRQTGRFHVTISANGAVHEIDALALLATVNSFGGADWRRADLSGGEIEVHVVRAGSTMQRAKVGRDLLTGAWRANPDIETLRATTLVVSGRRPRRWATVDGELSRERLPMRLAMHTRAVRLLAAPVIDPSIMADMPLDLDGHAAQLKA